jgi:hypothetical protein
VEEDATHAVMQLSSNQTSVLFVDVVIPDIFFFLYSQCQKLQVYSQIAEGLSHSKQTVQ